MEEAKIAGVIPLGAEWATTSTIPLLKGMKPFATFLTVESFSKWIEQNIEQNN